jgi:hypothetical protein
VTLCPRADVPLAEKDAFSIWAAESSILDSLMLGRLHGLLGHRWNWGKEEVYRITYWITSILASVIPISSIAVLYCVHSVPARLAIIALFNILVSVCLISLANAKRAEVFAITAA